MTPGASSIKEYVDDEVISVRAPCSVDVESSESTRAFPRFINILACPDQTTKEITIPLFNSSLKRFCFLLTPV